MSFQVVTILSRPPLIREGSVVLLTLLYHLFSPTKRSTHGMLLLTDGLERIHCYNCNHSNHNRI